MVQNKCTTVRNGLYTTYLSPNFFPLLVTISRVRFCLYRFVATHKIQVLLHAWEVYSV